MFLDGGEGLTFDLLISVQFSNLDVMKQVLCPDWSSCLLLRCFFYKGIKSLKCLYKMSQDQL